MVDGNKDEPKVVAEDTVVPDLSVEVGDKDSPVSAVSQSASAQVSAAIEAEASSLDTIINEKLHPELRKLCSHPLMKQAIAKARAESSSSGSFELFVDDLNRHLNVVFGFIEGSPDVYSVMRTGEDIRNHLTMNAASLNRSKVLNFIIELLETFAKITLREVLKRPSSAEFIENEFDREVQLYQVMKDLLSLRLNFKGGH